MRDAPKRPATYADLKAVPENLVAEIIDGESVTRHHGYIAPECELTAADTHCNPALSRKIDLYRRVGVLFMWLIGLRSHIVEAFELRDGSWTDIGTWSSDDVVRAPPLDAISFSLADLWPLDPPLGLNEDPTPYYAGDR